MHTIQSGILKADINPIGAELFSLYSKVTGKEYIWQGNPAWWAGRAPILFPIVCSMKGSAYAYNGKVYDMPKHGFVQHAEFSVAKKEGNKIVFEYSDNVATRKIYPFSFLLQVVFELDGNTLSVTYTVENRNSCDMYFSIGAHEAYRCPWNDGEFFEDYYLEFDKSDTYIGEGVTDAGLISGEKYTVIKDGRLIPLTYDMFAERDTLIFKNVPSSRVFLKSKKTTTVVEVNYQDAPHLGIWTPPGAPFVCIEPWYGLPDEAGHDGIIENKAGIVSLGANCCFSWTHDITVHEG